MSTDYLYERGGWTTMSLTEDYEIQVEATLEGRRILWNHTARVYDEKPTTMKASIRQKIRWGQGHWFVTLHNTGKLFRAALKGQISAGEFLSLLMYMYSVSLYVMTILQGFATLGLWLLDPGKPLMQFSAGQLLFGASIFAYSYLLLFYLADWLDNGIRFSLKTIPVMITGFFANMIVSFFNQVVGLIRYRDQQHWVKTDHAISARKVQNTAAPVRLPSKAA